MYEGFRPEALDSVAGSAGSLKERHGLVFAIAGRWRDLDPILCLISVGCACTLALAA